MRYIYIILLFVISISSVQAQKKITNKADKSFNMGKYFDAIDQYKFSYSKAKDKEIKAEIVFKTAECYRLLKDFRQAEIWYRKAIKKRYPNPLAVLYYANAMRANGNYEEAKAQYENYKTLVPDDPMGDIGLEACTISLDWINNPTRYNVVNMYYFNSREGDYSPAFGSSNYKTVLFASSREGGTGNKVSGVTGEYYGDIFKTRVDRKGKWSEPIALGEGVNTEFDEGAASTNQKCNTMYFTSFREDKEGNMVCKIFTSKKDGIVWMASEQLTLVADSITVGHPAISSDELTLLFVAEMKGGLGKKDIWKVTRSSVGAEWSAPENLGPKINTPGNEMFPFIHADGTLYFSSDGRMGMGGLDVFMASPTSKGGWVVENMKYPINSSADDFGIVFEKDKERGYLSSNRKGGRGGDDIYQFSLPPIEFKLIGIIRNNKTEEVIAGADVTLIGSDGTNLEKKSENDGTFTFKLSPNTDYRIVARRGGFLRSKGKESTKGMTNSNEFRMDLFMNPDDSRIDLEGIMYDLGKWNLRTESMVALETLVEILNDNPNITIEIGSHTDFRGSDQSNLELSAKRAQSVVDFLITYGIDEERLTSRGYGETAPKEIDKATANKFDFLNEGDVLTESFIRALPNADQQDICHQINRRTDFGLTGRDYVRKIKRKR